MKSLPNRQRRLSVNTKKPANAGFLFLVEVILITFHLTLIKEL